MSERAGFNKRWKGGWLACGVALGLALCAPALLARPRPDPEIVVGDSLEAAPTQNINVPSQISLQQAIEIAQSRYPGRVVRAETTTQNGRAVHEIRMLGTDNRVRTMRIDAQTGELR